MCDVFSPATEEKGSAYSTCSVFVRLCNTRRDGPWLWIIENCPWYIRGNTYVRSSSKQPELTGASQAHYIAFSRNAIRISLTSEMGDQFVDVLLDKWNRINCAPDFSNTDTSLSDSECPVVWVRTGRCLFLVAWWHAASDRRAGLCPHAEVFSFLSQVCASWRTRRGRGEEEAGRNSIIIKINN